MKKFTHATLIFLFVSHVFNSAIMAQNARSKELFDQFKKTDSLYVAKKLGQKEYLNTIDSLSVQFYQLGEYVEDSIIATHLYNYRQIVWNNKEFEAKKIDYYTPFLNMNKSYNKRGAAMYYSEKISSEAKKLGINKSMLELSVKLDIFLAQREYSKMVQLFDSKKEEVYEIIKLIEQDSSQYRKGIEILYVFNGLKAAYIKNKDTTNLKELVKLTDKIAIQFRKNNDLLPRNKYLTELIIHSILFSEANFLGDSKRVQDIFKKFETLRNNFGSELDVVFKFNYYLSKIEFFIAQNLPDSAAYYLDKYDSISNFGDNRNTSNLIYRAQIQELKGDFEGAYVWLDEANSGLKKDLSNLIGEIDELLYTYTKAENTEREVAFIQEKSQRLQNILISGLTIIILTFIVYWVITKKKEAKIKLQLKNLDDMANLQISILEEVKDQAKREEQMKLGRELHDNLSSIVACLSHNIEHLKTFTNEKNKYLIESISKQTKEIYEIARSKSHSLIEMETNFGGPSYKNKIELLIETALPKEIYNTSIEIDENCIPNISLETRIELMRIIQESITNIIKHSKANEVSLLLYEDKEEIILTIYDNGIGINKSKLLKNIDKKSYGLKNIQERVQKLGGTITYNEQSQGTEVCINIPISITSTSFSVISTTGEEPAVM